MLKVRGARTLIEKYRADQSFTRSAAQMLIADLDPETKKPRSSDYEMYFDRQGAGRMPAAVFEYLVAHGVFRVGLELKCSNCELVSWVPLDEVRTVSTCAFCGYQFDVTRQLKDRDWRYRRSGLFGKDDHQEGGIPVALTVLQLDSCLRDHLLMYSTALKFEAKSAALEKCESDFLAIVSGAAGIGEAAVQILLGEAKTHKKIEAEDVRKLGKLADAIPRGAADTFIMFSKTDVFSHEEIEIVKSLNSQFRKRVILWSENELEPYFVYHRSKERLNGTSSAHGLSDMARITHELWFR